MTRKCGHRFLDTHGILAYVIQAQGLFVAKNARLLPLLSHVVAGCCITGVNHHRHVLFLPDNFDRIWSNKECDMIEVSENADMTLLRSR
jgi:hypothetical protein